MIPELAHRLKELRKRIALIRKQDLCFSVETEACFRLADLELRLVCARLENFMHSSPEVQVWLHKILIPALLAEKEYYRLINYANSFCPEQYTRLERLRFWIEQAKRLSRFQSKHAIFYEYEISGSTISELRHYSFQAPESYVELRGSWLARQRYDKYVRDKLQSV